MRTPHIGVWISAKLVEEDSGASSVAVADELMAMIGVEDMVEPTLRVAVAGDRVLELVVVISVAIAVDWFFELDLILLVLIQSVEVGCVLLGSPVGR